MGSRNGFSKRSGLKLAVIAAAFLLSVGFAWSSQRNRIERVELSAMTESDIETAADPEKARAAFNEAVKVFFSARCANCHPAGDIPTQGDEMVPHTQAVTRGKDGKGVYGQTCTTCHQAENLPGEHMPPGVSVGWHMPPADQKMVFQGLTAGQLCRQFKDPKQNGGKKTLKEAMHHLEADPLVLWGWNPGDGRTPPPMSHEEFMKNMNEWMNNGAACPE